MWFTVDLPATNAPTFNVRLPVARPPTLDERLRAALPGTTREIAARLNLPIRTTRHHLSLLRGVRRWGRVWGWA